MTPPDKTFETNWAVVGKKLKTFLGTNTSDATWWPKLEHVLNYGLLTYRFSSMVLLAAGMDRSHTFCEESLHPSYFDHSLSLEECYQHCEVQKIIHRNGQNWENTQL